MGLRVSPFIYDERVYMSVFKSDLGLWSHHNFNTGDLSFKDSRTAYENQSCMGSRGHMEYKVHLCGGVAHRY